MLTPLTTEPLLPFSPARWAPGGDLQTLAGYLLPSPTQLSNTKLHYVPVSDEDRLALCENLPSTQSAQGILLLLHGLGGHADSPYMLRIAARFLAQGWITFRLNHRGAGQGRGLARRLYHAGMSEDLGPVLQRIFELRPDLPIVVSGFSLNGNMLLKYLGEGWQTPPTNLCGAIALCPPIDLALSSHAMRRKKNRLYDLRFVGLLKRAMQERYADFSDFPPYPLSEVATVYDFDQRVTAPHHGFLSAEDYYEQCGAQQFLPKVSLPTIIIASADDPFIPKQSFLNLPRNELIKVFLTHSGGHMGFVARNKTAWGDFRWMDYAIAWWAERLVQEEGSSFIKPESQVLEAAASQDG